VHFFQKKFTTFSVWGRLRGSLRFGSCLEWNRYLHTVDLIVNRHPNWLFKNRIDAVGLIDILGGFRDSGDSG